jgi:hypothetical protein
MQYDLDINDIDSVQFVNHYMPLEQDMHILTDDEFDNKLEELLDFVFGPEPFKFIVFFYESGKELIYNTSAEAYDVAIDLCKNLNLLIKIGWQQRPYSKEVVIAIVQKYSFC